MEGNDRRADSLANRRTHVRSCGGCFREGPCSSSRCHQTMGDIAGEDAIPISEGQRLCDLRETVNKIGDGLVEVMRRYVDLQEDRRKSKRSMGLDPIHRAHCNVGLDPIYHGCDAGVDPIRWEETGDDSLT